MAYLDITCAACGTIHHNGPKKTKTCPQCGSADVVVLPHDFEIDDRFREEREHMLERMGE